MTGLPKGKWVEVLPNVLWSIQTTATRPTGFSPFCLLYGAEAVTPEEIPAGSFRTCQQSIEDEDISKDLLDETKLQAVANLQRYLDSVQHKYNRRVNPREFSPGDLVRHRHPNPVSVGKLRRKWQGPFVVDKSVRPGAYHLLNLDGTPLLHTWNADMLK